MRKLSPIATNGASCYAKIIKWIVNVFDIIDSGLFFYDVVATDHPERPVSSLQ